jgi:hypothetical protein
MARVGGGMGRSIGIDLIRSNLLRVHLYPSTSPFAHLSGCWRWASELVRNDYFGLKMNLMPG